MTAHYRCLGCGFVFSQAPGPVAQFKLPSNAPHTYAPAHECKQRADDGCPECGHVYIKWLNYERDFAPLQEREGAPV